jgi:hypothetical protein
LFFSGEVERSDNSKGGDCLGRGGSQADCWVKVPVQFLALAVVAKAENKLNSLKIARALVRFDPHCQHHRNANHLIM